jgi:hypothetical protein
MPLPRVLVAAPVAALMLALAATASARVLRVGPGRRFARPCQAIAAAHAGDTIQIDARGNRSYRGDVCAWSTNGLRIIGVHGRAHIDAPGPTARARPSG